MRVVLEFNSVLRDRFSGFFTYGAGLLRGFAELAEQPEVVLFCPGRVRGHGAWLQDAGAGLKLTWAGSCVKARYLDSWWRWVKWPALQGWTGDFDVYHCNHHLMPPTKSRPRLLTVHDLRRYRYPEFYPNSKLGRFEHAVATADHFIAISHATKADLQQFFDVPDEKIDVVHHGGPLRAGGGAADDAAGEGPGTFGLTAGRYFAAFSSYDQRKNLAGIIEGFALAARELPGDYRLAVMGGLPEGAEGLLEAVEPAARERVVFTGPLLDCGAMLAEARGLVFASFYEGFGLPILEGMAAGTAVITSNCSSMPEVAGEAALLVDPLSPEEMAEAMVRLVEDEAEWDTLVQAGRQRAREFSWARAAEETVGVYQKLM